MDLDSYSAKVRKDQGKVDRVRIRQQLRIIIADVLFEIGMKLVRWSKALKRQNEVEDILKKVRSNRQ